MPKYSTTVVNLLDQARNAALLAVETFNRPTARFRSGSYIVQMQLAWTLVLLASLHHKRIRPYYK